MARTLPPLGALRAFEAAARHLSFTRAGAELHVTQAAISHRVKALEDWLGLPLFRRLHRALRLTEEGQAYLPAVRDALDTLSVATERLRGGEESRILTVTTTDSFAAAWLMPRLKRFRAAHRDLDLRLQTADELVDFTRADVDLAVRYGRRRWPGLHVTRLLSEDIFPVCSPALCARHPLRTPADLAHHILLHDDMTITWEVWLRAAGITGIEARRGPFFQSSYLVMNAALAGDGVALGRSALVADALAEGRLIRPFTVSLPADYAYYVVSPEATADRPKIRAFREWILAEARAADGGLLSAGGPCDSPGGEKREIRN